MSLIFSEFLCDKCEGMCSVSTIYVNKPQCPYNKQANFREVAVKLVRFDKLKSRLAEMAKDAEEKASKGYIDDKKYYQGRADALKEILRMLEG